MVEKTRQMIWDALLDYGRIERQRILNDLEKAPDVTYNDVMDEVIVHNMDTVWCVKGPIASGRNLLQSTLYKCYTYKC